MKTFKSIKIASDLSKNAKTAYDFAQKLGEELHATLSLVHVYMQPNSPNSTSLLGFMPSLKELEEDALKKLKHFAHNPDAHLEVYPGSATDTLLKLSAETDLLVMGTHGEQGLIDKVFGSVSLSVSRNADCPVLIVPKKAKYKGIKQILFATAETSVDAKHIDRVADFAKKWVQKSISFTFRKAEMILI